ncbi:MAG TPA: hypothetical protein VHQ23_09930 [Ilumatobacteraceae bacterium]|nr:hypothetical protein [Ilumatobacteraceae bacterium]
MPTEIFINPPSAVRRYFADEDHAGRRLTAHMLATGFVMFRAEAVVDELRVEAASWLAKDTPASEFDRVSTRYAIASELEDALDIVGVDEVTAAIILGDVVLAVLEYFCKSETGRIPRRKDLLAEVAARDPTLADLASKFVRAAAVPARTEFALAMADRVLRVRGFFEWDSGPGPPPN